MRRWWMVPLASLAVMSGLLLAVVKADDQAAVNPVAPAGNAQADQQLADHQLAEYFCLLAAQVMRNADSPAQGLPQGIALLQAAARLNPTEPRFARLLADAEMNAGDQDAAIQAIQAYLKLNPSDTFAQTQLVELYLAQQQGVSKKLDYLKAVVDKASVPPEVRSFAAAQAAKLYFTEQGDRKNALDQYQQALAQNPLNLDALNGKYDLSRQDATPAERVSQLLAMLKVNPGQPEVVNGLALHLAAAGLINEAVQWFHFTDNLYHTVHQSPSFAFGQGAGAELFLADRPDDAIELLNAHLTAYPGDDGGWNILLAITKWEVGRNANNQAAVKLDQDLKLTGQIALLNRLQMVRKAMGVTKATTQPVDLTGAFTIPDLSNDATLLKNSTSANLTTDYIDAVAALAWMELYFRHDATAADPLLESLGTLLPEKDVMLARLRGWRRLVDGDAQVARQKLSAVEDRDPLAKLGVIMIDLQAGSPQTVAQATLRAKQLLALHPSGALAAVLYGELHATGATIEPTRDAQAIAAMVKQFPSDWVNVLQHPEDFYALKLEPTQVTFEFGEPVLLKVTLQAINNYDLLLGPEGIIHRELWFDAQLHGNLRQTVYGAAFDRIGQGVVLHPGKSLAQIVRVDDQLLAPLFYNSAPQDAIPADFTVLTNIGAMDKKDMQAQSGLCGYKVTTMNPIERKPVIVTAPGAMKLLKIRLASGTADDRMRLLTAARLYVAELRQNANLAAANPGLLDDLSGVLDHAISIDANPTVRYWAAYQQALVSDVQALKTPLTALASSDLWTMRLLSLTVAPALPDKGQALATTLLATDGDPQVKTYAAALLARLAQSAATRPSPRPDTQPAGNVP